MRNRLAEKMNGFSAADAVREAGIYPYFRPISSEQDTEVIIRGRKVLMFGSNSYLGLTTHPVLKEASQKAVEKYGSGCAGSRFLNGTLDLHLELEDALAQYVGKEGALVFSTGYQVNLGVISALMGRQDNIINDSLNHASIIDGGRLSFAKKRKFKHNDMADLELMLQRIAEEQKGTDRSQVNMIVADGMFSMEGDVIKLDEVVALAKKYEANVMIDEAHSLGVIGDMGRGVCNEYGLTDDVDLIMGTFSKSLASIGGFIAADADTIDFLKHNARSLIFSASITPANAASALAALKLIEREPQRIEKLWSNTHLAHKVLKEKGFDTGESTTPVIPIYVRNDHKTFVLTQRLLEEGVFVNPVVSPAVPEDSSLIRFSLMATHSEDQILTAIDKLEAVAKELHILNIENPV